MTIIEGAGKAIAGWPAGRWDISAIPESTPHIRRRVDAELRELKVMIRSMGAAAQNMFERSLHGIVDNRPEIFDDVIRSDDEVDAHYMEIERRILDVLALHSPVASDLRFLTALLHVSLHLERVADMSVNVAKLGEAIAHLPRNDTVLTTISEMGGIALKMIEASMDAFANRDLELCMRLPEMDDPVDRLNRGIIQEILPMCNDMRLLEWGMQIHVVSRQIERVADHAVDIAEQTAFLITGEFREFTDASHPGGVDL
ncbi:MAG TPA: phosphate signaling complex protein PhoU [Actinomycetota bacterium]|nr:phosphate signaling complex protein PhoU [Actinomycetota bacterium]